MWQTKRFKTREKRDAWIQKHGHHYQIQEVYINNGYALDVRRLKVI